MDEVPSPRRAEGPQPVDFVQTVREVRLALDTVACQVRSDYKHRPRSASRSPTPSRRSISNIPRSLSSSNLLDGQDATHHGSSSRPITLCQQQQPQLSPRAASMLATGNPVLAAPAAHCFADYYQARKAGSLAEAFYSCSSPSSNMSAGSRQPMHVPSVQVRRSPDVPSYYNTEGNLPSGLKHVLSKLQPVRAAPVVLHQSRCASADAFCTERLRTCSWDASAGQHKAAASMGSSSNISSVQRRQQQQQHSLLLHGLAGSSALQQQQQQFGYQRQPSPVASMGLLAPMARPWSGAQSPVQHDWPVSPQNMLVLRTLALHTPYNIVPPVVLDHAAEQASCRQGCSGARSPSPARLLSPQLQHLVCCCCSQQHSLQQHQSCCHRCPSCCQCSSTAGQELQQCEPAAEASAASSDTCRCPCIKAYKKGQRDTRKAAAEPAAATAAATGGSRAQAASEFRPSELASGCAEAMEALQLTNASVAAALAHAHSGAEAAAAATAAAVTSMDGMAATATEQEEEQGAPVEDGLMRVLQQLAATQAELLQQGPPFDADQMGELADQLAQCVGLSEAQHEHLLRRVLEQQQEMLSIQQRALLDSTSGAGGQQQHQAPQLQLRSTQQLQQQQGWGELDALELPDEFGGAAAAEAEAAGFRVSYKRTGSWVAQHNQHQQQQQQLQEPFGDDQGEGSAGGYPATASGADPGGSYGFQGGSEQDFEGPLAARLPAGAIVSSSPAMMMPRNGSSATSIAVFKWAGEDDMAEDNRAAVAAAAAYAAVPDPVKPTAQLGSAAYSHASCNRASNNAIGRQGSRQRAFTGANDSQGQSHLPQTVQELAGALAAPVYPQQEQWQRHSAAAQFTAGGQPGGGSNSIKKQLLPGIDEIESVLAAYNAAGVFPRGQAGEAQTREPLLHFMMAPQHATADGAAEAGGAVLHRAPPQVTAVAQLVQGQPALSRLSSAASRHSARASGINIADASSPNVHMASSHSIADSAWSVVAAGHAATTSGAAPAAYMGRLSSYEAPASPLGAAAGSNSSRGAYSRQQSVGIASPGQAPQQQQQQQQLFQWQPSTSATMRGTAAASLEQHMQQVQQADAACAAAAATAAAAGSAGLPPALASSRTSSIRSVTHLGGEWDHIESHLSRLSNIWANLGSTPGSAASTPRPSSRLASEAGGAISSPGAAGAAGLHVSTAGSSAGAAGEENSRLFVMSGSHSGALCGSTAQHQQHISAGDAVNSPGLRSPRLSVRFLDEHQAEPAAAVASPGRTGIGNQQQQQQLAHAQLQPQQNLQAQVQVPPQLHSVHVQQTRRSSVARAGSFQAPDSEPSSAATSARPSVSQLPAQTIEAQQKMLSVGEQLAALQQAAAGSGRSRAVSTRQSSINAHSAGTSAVPGAVALAVPAALLQAGSSARLAAAGSSTSGSGANTPAGARPSSSSAMPQAVNAVFSAVESASRASCPSDASGVLRAVQQQQQQQQRAPVDLEQLASPQASLPGNTRSSMSSLPTGLFPQQKQQPQPPRQSTVQASSSMAVRPSVAVVPMPTTAASAPGSVSGTPSDWKQQQLVMQQQLAAQQQQLRQLQSLSNSVVSSPRASVAVSHSATVGRNSAAPGAGAALPAVLPEAHAVAASSPGVVSSPDIRTHPQAALGGRQSSRQSRSHTGAVDLSAAPAAVELPAELLVGSNSEDDPTSGSSAGRPDGQALLRGVLLERLLQRRKGRLMQKALSTWWRYTVAVCTLTEGCQDTQESSRRSSSQQSAQQPEQAVDVHFSSLQGLRQGLAAAMTGKSRTEASGGTCGDDVEIIVSGQVRLQCSPVRQRPQHETAAQGVAESGAVTRALAVVASRSPDRCRAAGRSKGTAAAMQQAADEKAAAVAAAAFAAQAQPLKAALQEVHGMIAAMENMCHGLGHGNSSTSSNGEGPGPAQVLTYKSSPSAAAAAAKAARAGTHSCWQWQSSPVPCSRQHLPQQLQQQRLRSPDRYRLRGQLKHVQDQLVKLEVKMNQAAAMQEDPCFCNSAADSMAARCSSPTRGSPGGDSIGCAPGGVLHSPSCKGGSGAAGCKGGCVRRVAGKRQVLVGRMQNEISQLQQELAQLREMMPGAYA